VSFSSQSADPLEDPSTPISASLKIICLLLIFAPSRYDASPQLLGQVFQAPPWAISSVQRFLDHLLGQSNNNPAKYRSKCSALHGEPYAMFRKAKILQNFLKFCHHRCRPRVSGEHHQMGEARLSRSSPSPSFRVPLGTSHQAWTEHRLMIEIGENILTPSDGQRFDSNLVKVNSFGSPREFGKSEFFASTIRSYEISVTISHSALNHLNAASQ
jgi:hypothetical protein